MKKINLPMFYVGQKIVCDDNTLKSYIKLDEQVPVKGLTYTVRDVLCFHNGYYLLLREIVNKPFPYAEGHHEFCFGQYSFSPLQQTKFPKMTFKEISKIEINEPLILN